ncbi:hypothetical protein ABH935_000193 [Catenulispora sp. GAS73]|uniref:hypothetical protein n=1 Tax=Catenulispora sp. GAS73 TaxID=3156269 RepID=UPI003516F00E
MRAVAEGPLATVNNWLNQNVVPAGVLTGAVLALGGVLWATLVNRRRLTWSVVYDAPINIDDQDLWTIKSAQTNEGIEEPQLVVLEIRNAGLLEVREEDWDSRLKFAFTGVTVVDLKVRNDSSHRRHGTENTDGVRDRVEKQRSEDRAAAERARKLTARSSDDERRAVEQAELVKLFPKEENRIQLPPFNLNRGASFQVMALLDGPGSATPRSASSAPATSPAAASTGPEAPGGGVPSGSRSWRWWRWWPASAPARGSPTEP